MPCRNVLPLYFAWPVSASGRLGASSALEAMGVAISLERRAPSPASSAPQPWKRQEVTPFPVCPFRGILPSLRDSVHALSWSPLFLCGIFKITSPGSLGLWVDGAEIQPATSLNACLLGELWAAYAIVVSPRNSSVGGALCSSGGSICSHSRRKPQEAQDSLPFRSCHLALTVVCLSNSPVFWGCVPVTQGRKTGPCHKCET